MAQRRLKILIVEDDPILQQAYLIVLNTEGYEVKAAGDGREGLKTANSFKPDIILLDMHMPRMNGIEFLREYKPLNQPKTKVVVFSNMSGPEQTKEALTLGATEYLTKSSFAPKDIIEKIKSINKKAKLTKK